MSWPTVSLGDVFEVARGGSPRPIDDYITDDLDGVNWISIRDASNSSKYITHTEKKIKKSGVSKSRMVYPGEFLLTNSMSFGRPYILKTSGCIHDGWLVLSSNKDVIDQNYFFHLLGSEQMYRKFASLAAGAVVKNLNTELVKKVSIPLPPLPEQRRIAAILDKADALRAKRREAITKLNQLLQSVFLETFGDPVTNPKGWPLDTLKQLGKVQTGTTPPSTATQMFGGEIPFVTPGDLGGPIISTKRTVTEAGSKKSRLAEAGSTLVCCIGATIGKMGLTTRASTFNQQINSVTWSEQVDAWYGFYVMTFFAKEIASRGASTTLPILKKSEFEKIRFPVAPRSMQNDFKIFMRSHLAEKQRMATSIGLMDSMFTSLQSQAFTGQL